MMVPNIELALKYICVNCWQVLVKISKFSIFVGIEWILLVHNGLKEFLKSHWVFCLQNYFDLLWEKKCSSDWEKLLKFEAEVTKTMKKNSERSEQFLVTECFFNLFLEVSQLSKNRTIIIQIGKNYWDLEIFRKS